MSGGLGLKGDKLAMIIMVNNYHIKNLQITILPMETALQSLSDAADVIHL